jgi:peptidyl-tRNA hydrolase
MKFLIPLLMAALPVASAAQSQPGDSGLPSAAIPPTTQVIVILTPRQGVTARQIIAVMPSEIRATVKLYLDGKIREWYSRGDGKGVVFLVDAKTEDEARTMMETLPLAKEQLMDHQYIPVGPLMPLRMLIGPAAQQ